MTPAVRTIFGAAFLALMAASAFAQTREHHPVLAGVLSRSFFPANWLVASAVIN